MVGGIAERISGTVRQGSANRAGTVVVWAQPVIRIDIAARTEKKKRNASAFGFEMTGQLPRIVAIRIQIVPANADGVAGRRH